MGSYANGASPYGAQEMAGNVWEWTNTVYKPYPYIPGDGRERAESTESRVLRGGSWDDVAGFARVACRISLQPGNVFDYYGFRVVLAAPIS